MVQRRWLPAGAACFLMLISGCGETYLPTSSAPISSAAPVGGAELATAVSSVDPTAETTRFFTATQVDPGDTPPADRVPQRLIIYDTNIGLVVEDYRQFESELPLLVAKYGGFVANSDTDRRYNDRQTGTWVVRIPVVRYLEFLPGITALGFAESRSENAQDVSEEYIDIEARIRNKQSLETRIVAMLEERDGRLTDVLEIERELARVREEIERLEGRLRFLKNRTSLATITIRCREQREYQPAEAPTLGSRLNQTWAASLATIRRAGENALVGLIAVIPWLTVITIPMLVAWKALRWLLCAKRLRTGV